MPTSVSSFGHRTTGDTVVAAFRDQVKGRIILITGANPAGIGGTTAVALAEAAPKLLIIAGRSPDKLAATSKQINDANASVIAAAQAILDDPDVPHLDLLINNAGVMDIPKRELSPEGIEMHFATNHIGHFLFTNLIAPKIIAGAKFSPVGTTRIVNLSSRAVGHGPVRFSDWNFTKKESEIPASEHMNSQIRELWDEHEDKPYIPHAAYGQSKSANAFFTLQSNQLLFEKLGVMSIAVHPGLISSELGRHLAPGRLTAALEKYQTVSPEVSMKNLEQGYSTTLVAALDPSVTSRDLFLADCQVADWVPAYYTDPQKALQLWELSEEIVGQKFVY